MSSQKMILAGDVGGTKTHVALFSRQHDKPTPVRKQTFSSKDYSGLEPVLREFLSPNKGPVKSACFGVAGPVIGGRTKTPNLPWVLDAGEIARSVGIGSVILINDLEATAYGVLELDEAEFVSLNRVDHPPDGNMALIAPGTGLGEAILYWDGSRHCPSASEGGHGDFAARDALEIDLLRYLIPRFGHVSYERVVSGPGLVNIYHFLKESGRFAEPPDLREKLEGEDPAAVISQTALADGAEICVKALEIFVSVWGAEAGNLVLKAKAVRGLYIGGGIAPKILEKLKDGTFMRAFTDKGRYSEFLANVPVRVVMNPEAALLGAAWYAFQSERVGRSPSPGPSSARISKT